MLLPPETLARDDTAQLIEDNMTTADQVNNEDIALNVSQQRGLSSRQARPGRLNALEGANIQFADYITKKITRNAPPGRLKPVS